MGTASPESEQGNPLGQVTTLGYSERRTIFATRVMDCVSRAFRAMGTSPLMEDFVFWNVSTDQDLGLNEIIDKPRQFVESLASVFGEAGAAVFEYKLVKEVQEEFSLVRAKGNEVPTSKRALGEMVQAAVTAAWMAPL